MGSLLKCEKWRVVAPGSISFSEKLVYGVEFSHPGPIPEATLSHRMGEGLGVRGLRSGERERVRVRESRVHSLRSSRRPGVFRKNRRVIPLLSRSSQLSSGCLHHEEERLAFG
jgi:hypothetical protein